MPPACSELRLLKTKHAGYLKLKHAKRLCTENLRRALLKWRSEACRRHAYRPPRACVPNLFV